MPEMQYVPAGSIASSDYEEEEEQAGDKSCWWGCNGLWATDLVGGCCVSMWACIASACSGCNLNC